MIKQKNDKALKSTERKGETKVRELLLSSRVGPEGGKKEKEKELKTAVASQTERETTALIL